MSGEGSFSGLFGRKGSNAAQEMPPLVAPAVPSQTDPSPGADDHVSQPIPFARPTMPEQPFLAEYAPLAQVALPAAEDVR